MWRGRQEARWQPWRWPWETTKRCWPPWTPLGGPETRTRSGNHSTPNAPWDSPLTRGLSAVRCRSASWLSTAPGDVPCSSRRPQAPTSRSPEPSRRPLHGRERLRRRRWSTGCRTATWSSSCRPSTSTRSSVLPEHWRSTARSHTSTACRGDWSITTRPSWPPSNDPAWASWPTCQVPMSWTRYSAEAPQQRC